MHIVIIGMILVCHHLGFSLFNMGSIYSYVSSYYALRLELSYNSLSMSLCVSTNVGDSLVVNRVYRSCVVIV